MSDDEIKLKVCVDLVEEIIDVSLDPSGEFHLYEVQLPDVIRQGIKIELDADNLLNKWMIVEN